MLLRPRIIPTLLIDQGDLVKTKRFKSPTYLGDPINAIKIFNEKGVDELCILDISSTRSHCGPNYSLLRDMATEAFMPLSYGGGLGNYEQIERVLSIGFEKVILNTALIEKPQFVIDVIGQIGSQSVVASIDYSRQLSGTLCCHINGGRKRVNLNPLKFAKLVETLGVGEILLSSISKDGMMSGYDINTLERVSKEVSIPVIARGGAGKLGDFRQALDIGRADAVSAGSLFVYYGIKKAVLINYPDEQELCNLRIYREKNEVDNASIQNM